MYHLLDNGFDLAPVPELPLVPWRPRPQQNGWLWLEETVELCQMLRLYIREYVGRIYGNLLNVHQRVVRIERALDHFMSIGNLRSYYSYPGDDIGDMV